ncbi:hypothetical protein JIN84_19945 [Luteolibacter yonseiensis]|uniref:Uncharacterized protein n=1 Tax=Luteolibacter yonseiensis TaxID=1144680 RepID=A0A934R6K5_9BACT|nr:hypothetical protein [Luteolibacter yonseiensis]MBK1817904.1 hypothetical protein [Luteolibacter yonseiensis]
MNAEVAASVARARNSVQDPASSAGSRKFWRVVPNWSLDSDGDSTPDWLEFDLIVRDQSDPGTGSGGGSGGGGNEGGPRGDPFSGDTNHNGIPDGDELDSDGDGIVDKNDASKSDEQINWVKGGAMRFAWFDVMLPAEGDPLLGDKKTPFQVNDQGKVLFKNSLWHNGGLVDLPDIGTDLSFCGSIALGDDGLILGQGAIDFPGDEYEATVSCMVRWSSAGGAPVVLKVGDIYPQVTRDVGYGLINPDMLLNENNEFIGYQATKVDYNADYEEGGEPRYGYKYPVPNPLKIWKLKPSGSGGDVVTSGADAPDFAGWVDAGGGFGGIGAGNPGKVTFGGGDDTHEFEENYNRSVKLPNGVTAMMRGYDRAIAPATMNNGSTPRYYAGDQWTAIAASSSFNNALDFSTDGRFAITDGFGIWHNGMALPMWNCSPGLPEDWRTRSNNFVTDTTRHGWTLAVRKEGGGPATKAMVGTPLFLETPTPSEGLDAVSFTASNSFNNELEGIKEEFWIMVPAGGNIPVRIRSGACPVTPVTLGGGTGSKVTASPSSVDSTNTVVTFSAPADADGTQEVVSIKLGELHSLSKPLRAKIMKPRVVKLSVWPLKKNPADPVPAIPPEGEFEEYLNDIYKKQINVSFDVTIQPPSNSGLAADAPFRVSDPPTGAQKAVTVGKNVGDIQVYIMGGDATLQRENPQSSGGSVKGITDPAASQVWMSVDGDANGAYAQRQNWLSTVTHEIGHVLFGRGHPDQGKGPAPLPLTDQRARIMYSARDLIGPSTQQRVCVKAEWDVAETWLKNRPLGDN